MRWIVVVFAGATAVMLLVVSLLGVHLLGVPRAATVPLSNAVPPAPVSPYAGTPAADFAAGVAGIVLPRAEPVPEAFLADYKRNTRDITAEEVADALAQVRLTLIAARLGHAMLVDHDPEPFLKTLAPTYWETWTRPSDPLYELAHELSESPARANRWTTLASDTTLAAVPRVDGRIAYRAATTFRGTHALETRPRWVLEVVTRFVWVYTLTLPDAESGVGIVVVRDEAVWDLPADYKLFCCEANLGVRLVDSKARAWGVDCDAYASEGLVRPGSPTELAAIPSAAFDLDQPLASAAGCQAAAHQPIGN